MNHGAIALLYMLFMNQSGKWRKIMPFPFKVFRGISLPEAPREMNVKDQFLLRIRWVELVDPAYGIYAEELVHIRESDLKAPLKNGTEFLNMGRDRYLWALNDQTISDLRTIKRNGMMTIPPSCRTW